MGFLRLLGGIYIYIIYTPNLGSRIALSGRKREQGRFRGSTEGAKGRSEGAMSEQRGASSEHEGAPGEHEGAPGEHRGSTEGAEREHEAVQGRSR